VFLVLFGVQVDVRLAHAPTFSQVGKRRCAPERV
jgi:hypothetical protein